MAKAINYLEEKIIQRFEARMNDTTAETFLVELSALADLPSYFMRLLRSYRLAARVANICWSFIKAFTEEPDNRVLHQAIIEDMASALSDYAPEHFAQPAMEKLHLAEFLEQLFNKMEQARTKEEAIELVYLEACAAAEQARAA